MLFGPTLNYGCESPADRSLAVGQSGGFHEKEVVRACQVLAFGGLDLSELVQVTLVADEHDGHLVEVQVMRDGLQPVLYVVERLTIRDVVHDDRAVGAAVVRG